MLVLEGKSERRELKRSEREEKKEGEKREKWGERYIMESKGR